VLGFDRNAVVPTQWETIVKLLGKSVFVLIVVAATSAAQAQGTLPATPPAAMHQGQPYGIPAESGQSAFGAIQEIVAALQSDPRTDWSKADIDALRQHLIDMDEVTLRADVRKEPVEGGLRIEVTGTGRTLAAIQRMVPEHAHEIQGTNRWTVQAATLPNGVVLTVTAADPSATQRIRALGFMGIMVQGSHHRMHHLAMAKGDTMHHR
jgi:hypothetical protein